jgi:hypothetical protein
VTTQQTAGRPATSRARVAPFIVVMIATLAFIAGISLSRIPTAIAPGPVDAAPAPAVQAAPTFDAVRFRAEERDSWLGANR